MNRNNIYILIFCLLFLGGCFPGRRTQKDLDTKRDLEEFCSEQEEYSSLLIRRAKAIVKLDGERYDARINLCYIPDSLIFLTAANTGFEIVRAAVYRDSMIFINRIDRIVYIRKQKDLAYREPVDFRDIENLLRRNTICLHRDQLSIIGNEMLWDYSVQDKRRRIKYNSNTLKISTFEFFNKKTGEYVVGELSNSDSLKLYSNYMLDDVEMTAGNADIIYNELMNVNISYNENKYLVITD